MNVSASARPAFCFAANYKTADVLHKPEVADAFERDYLRGEGEFFERNRDPRTALAYDGVNLDAKTGQVSGPRNWSAPSKECLDLGILTKALEGNAQAAELLAGGDVERAKAKALDMLGRKLTGYQEFHAKHPEFAGYLPWYALNEGGIDIAGEWKQKIPGLDNGEWMWTMLTAQKALEDGGHKDLAAGYAAYNQLLCDNVTRVFYDPEGVACRGDVRIVGGDTGHPTYEAANKGSYMTGEHGVHEGTMLIHYLTLFGKGMPAGASDKIWGDIQMKRVETRHGTTWQGFWGSSHESWANLFMPFRDHKGYNDLFRIREEIRSQNAVDRGYPGFATSTTNPRGGYLSDAGIEGVGSQPVTGQDTMAVYGCFPMLLQFASSGTSVNYGLAWLHSMLTAPRMQGPLGAGESVTNDGTAFAPLKTTDGSHPILLAMMGGLEQECGDVMKQRGVYESFMQRIDDEYKETFGARPLREPSGFAAPRAQVPTTLLGDYTG